MHYVLLQSPNGANLTAYLDADTCYADVTGSFSQVSEGFIYHPDLRGPVMTMSLLNFDS